MKIASVIVDIPTQALDSPYSYAVPDDMLVGEDLLVAEVGCAVLVTLGGRKAVGYIVALDDPPQEDSDTDLWGTPHKVATLRCIEEVLTKPFFDEEGAACAQYLAHRYVAPLSACVRMFVPPGAAPRVLRGRDGRWSLENPKISEVDDRWVTKGPSFENYTPRKNAVKQRAVLEAVDVGDVRVSELTREYGAVNAVLSSLEQRGVIVVEHRRRLRGDFISATKTSPLKLNDAQRSAVDAIADAQKAHNGSVVLVDGVTGSGKTEVYLQAIAHALDEGRHAMVLVPEISLTPQTVARFRGRFGDAVAVMHSRMTPGERFDQWDFIKSGQAKVVVGARSALFTPLSNVGLIVIDEEHEGSYKQDQAPRYHAREVARWMMERAGGVVVLGSATPSIESLYQAAKNPLWHAVSLPLRANARPLPSVEVVDMAAEFSQGHRSMFSTALTRALEEELSAGHKAVLLLNQRGFAKFLLCRDCGFVPECPHCSTSLTYHEQGQSLMCHHCGHTEPAPALCPECGSPYLRKFGAGTQRVEADLRSLLDGMPALNGSVPIIRMDADTTKAKGAHQALLESFGSADAAVLLGTQMIAKGLDFDDVTLVGVINADTQLHLPDYRAAERTFQLIEQVAGRAGRAELEGRVLVQTYEAEAIAIRAAASYDRPLFLKSELPKRKLLGFPPYVSMANILVWGEDEHSVATEAELIYASLEEMVRDEVGQSWHVLPAIPCVLGKLRNTYRYHIVVKAPLGEDMAAPLEKLFRSRKPNSRAHVALDIDPMDLL